MAILETNTGTYFKINFNECMVRGRAVYVNYTAYLAPAEREKEKERQEKQAKFQQRLREYLSKEYEELIAEIDKTVTNKEEVLSETEDNKINAERYPLLRERQDKMNELEGYEQKLHKFYYKYGETDSELQVSSTALEKLEELGFKNEWIIAPILMTMHAEVYVGEYNNEPINHKFYYSRLKAVMNENIEDC